jgi:hypothetical protein
MRSRAKGRSGEPIENLASVTACQVVMLERVMLKFLTELWRLPQCQSNCVTSNGHLLSSNRILRRAAGEERKNRARF